MPDYDLIAILGPTASGKTPFAAALAAELHTEIISADSRQIYRGMDLGTGKDLADYTVDGKQIPYHLIDIADPGYKKNNSDDILPRNAVPASGFGSPAVRKDGFAVCCVDVE